MKGYHMTREKGCVECPKNTYSTIGAMSCTPCPDNKLSPAGSKDETDCFSSGMTSCDCYFKKTILTRL